MNSEPETTLGRGAEPKPPKNTRRRWWPWLLLACILVLVAGIYAFVGRPGQPAAKRSAAQGPTAAPRSVPVVATAARKSDVGVYLNGLGTVTPLNTVIVKSRVDGQLMRVLFREGEVVRNGQLLAEIDPRPFQVQLTQAEGQMARDQAQLRNARLDLERFQQLARQDSIARQQVDSQEALVRQLEGALKVDQGLIDSARLQLVYARITAPLGGRIGLRQVDPGNIVHAADANGLVVITQLQPIAVIFPIPEDSLQQVLTRLKSGARMQVEAYDREQKQKLATGTLLTVDNQIDPATGTVKFKAVFPNKANELFPNQFVNARLLVEMKRDAVVVPASAIQRGPQGTFVYVVKDKSVAVRPVTLGVTQDGGASVSAGLEPGEIVVADGAERLREGSKVEVKEPNGQGGPGGPKGRRGPGPKGAGEGQKSAPPVSKGEPGRP
ncbi:MAG TPA: MdtA/MuxA family multidrug efflux RND transporter periplasmic adaptor subunit [Geobacteraceae bacterium]